MGRILLVEDDALLGDGVKAGLEDDGHVVEWVRDGKLAREALAVEKFGAVVLDLGLPRLDGLDILRELRARQDRTPVLILTARDTVEYRVRGLDAGADDYLVKPFELAELKARLRAIVRRAAGQATNVLRHRGVEMRLDEHAVLKEGQPVNLAPREYALLEALMSQPGRTFTRAQLEERLYAWGGEVESNAIEVHVHHLRAKLFPDLIRTVRGVGYALAPVNG
ncbi:MAG TPA: response regulator [Usitatibacter sp.]|nr:response regulator [Usitatibacter sp.]